MSNSILIYGEPGVGKTESLNNLDPNSTIIIDADKKGLEFENAYLYSRDKGNYFKTNSIDDIIKTLINVGNNNEKWKHIKTLVIDGMNNVWARGVFSKNDSNNKFEKYAEIGEKTYKLFDLIQDSRDDLCVIVTAHVKHFDPYIESDTDRVFTPGKVIEDKIKLESKFNYVFYAKAKDGEYFFETKPNRSTARSPRSFPETIPNDVAAAIQLIKNLKSKAGAINDQSR